MPVILGGGLVLQPAPAAFSANNPIVGYHNVITVAGVVAETEAAGAPALNLANPSTYLFWRGANATAQRITFSIPAEYVGLIDYVGVAAHNLGTVAASIAIEARANVLDAWTQQVAPQMLSDDSPYLGRFTPASFAEVSILLGAGAAAPQIAAVYVGKLLVLERRIYVGHQPMTFNRETSFTTGESEEGQFLGRLQSKQMQRTALDLQNITPAFYRSSVEPWFQHAATKPFFWAWRPSSYPHEVGYAWSLGDPTVSNQRSNGMMQAALNLRGITR